MVSISFSSTKYVFFGSFQFLYFLFIFSAVSFFCFLFLVAVTNSRYSLQHKYLHLVTDSRWSQYLSHSLNRFAWVSLDSYTFLVFFLPLFFSISYLKIYLHLLLHLLPLSVYLFYVGLSVFYFFLVLFLNIYLLFYWLFLYSRFLRALQLVLLSVSITIFAGSCVETFLSVVVVVVVAGFFLLLNFLYFSCIFLAAI